MEKSVRAYIVLRIEDGAYAQYWWRKLSHLKVGIFFTGALSFGSKNLCVLALFQYSDTVHTLIERKGYKGLFLPGNVAESWS